VNAGNVNEAVALLQTATDTLSLDQLQLILEALDQRAQELMANGDPAAAERLFTVGSRLELYSDSNDAVYVFIPPGPFTIGSDPEQDPLALNNEVPQHTVDVDGFWIMRTEVTNAQYGRCVEAGICSVPGNDDWNRSELAGRPVTNVTWVQASTYAAWVGGRLPTEAQWEKACRGTDARIYPWGDEPPTEDRLNFNANIGATTDVGNYPLGAYGLYDMAGNVWEWTSSQYQDYPYDSDDGREDLEGDAWRTLRGGSFDDLVDHVRCAVRFNYGPASSGFVFGGFRVVVVSPGS